MLIWLYAHIGYFLTGLLITACYFGYKAKDYECWMSSIIICLIAFPAWLKPWNNPESLGTIHFYILCLTLISLNNGMLKKLSISVLLMLIADSLSYIHLTANNIPLTNASLFWWRSALNILFAYQCLIVLNGSRAIIRKRSKVGQGNRNEGFLARTIPNNH